jgi:DNA helicase-2/ATP-dependent DNA helicase PcrA
VLVIAGAGSGKTRTLTHRLAYLIANGVPPRSIVALTFTNKAAAEMRERVHRLLGSPPSLPFCGTFHSFAASILRRDGAAIGLPPHFTIIDEDEAERVMKRALKNLDIPPDTLSAHFAREFISRMKNECRGPDSVAEFLPRRPQAAALKAAWEEYERILEQEGAVDFDNLLTHVLTLFAKRPEIRKSYQRRIRHILVDEYQDINTPQYLLIRHLAGERGNVFVVGDDWQAIYTFRGSDFHTILRFHHDWPNARIYFLEQNFRSTKTIVEAANHLIAKNQYRTEKYLFTENDGGPPILVTRLRDEREEAEYVARHIEEKLSSGAQPSDFAVFFRTHAQSRPLEERFIERGIPYRLVGGTKFYQRREIRDMIAYLRFIVNPRDTTSMARIANIPPRGIGPKTLHALLRGTAPPHHEGVRAFFDLIREGRRRAATDPPSTLLRWLIRRTRYDAYLEPETEEGAIRLENVRELLSVSRAFDAHPPPEGLHRFLDTVALLTDADEYDRRENRVSLMTIHAAKGLEFPVVFIVGCEEGIFPHRQSFSNESALEEERRLAYVALTRAKFEVHLTHVRRRLRFGAQESNPPSRFLSELPWHCVLSIDQTLAEGDDGYSQPEILLD